MTDRFARGSEFWARLGRAAIIGASAGLAVLGYTQLVKFGTELIYSEDVDYSFVGGEAWVIAALGLTGLIVGLLRLWLRVPEELDGSLTIVQKADIDRNTSLQAIGVSLVSLIGGASLGPFDGGTRIGATIGDWYSTIRRLPSEERTANVLSGLNGSFGGLLTAPVVATFFITELRWPERRLYYRVLIPGLTAAIFGFVVNFAVLGDTFLGAFSLPGYDVKGWHLALGVVLGLVAAALSWLLGMTVFVFRYFVIPLVSNGVARAALGGLALGVIVVLFPLTFGSGKGQLGAAIDQFGDLGTAVLVAVVFAKVVAIAISLTTGFIGGPVMPTLFVGGMAGLAIHSMFPDIPIALAFSCLLVAVPGVSVGAPLTMVFLAALTVGVGPVQATPAAIAVLTAYVLTIGLGWFGLPVQHATVDIDESTTQLELFEVGEATPDTDETE